MAKYEYRVIRSGRRTLSMEIRPDGGILVRAPYQADGSEIEAFVRRHEAWLEKHLAGMQEKREKRKPYEGEHLTRDEIRRLAEEAAKDIPQRLKKYAPLVGVSYGRVTIRNQKSRWGSCSAKGNLNFNCLLMLAPEDVRDYVVVHELCHRKQMNHSPRFWHEVERVLPDYKKQVQWLKDNGGALMARMVEY